MNKYKYLIEFISFIEKKEYDWLTKYESKISQDLKGDLKSFYLQMLIDIIELIGVKQVKNIISLSIKIEKIMKKK